MRDLKKFRIGFFKGLTSKNVQENYPWVLSGFQSRLEHMKCFVISSFHFQIPFEKEYG